MLLDGGVCVGGLGNDLSSGHGRMSWANGANYVGAWLKDKMQGAGTYTLPAYGSVNQSKVGIVKLK